ncbi:hypothetical protein FOA52_002661 [Chlamydomonas sp. UWO 241]|nr:hypothetical protein FOA52_002661 [Chlamydomonas sp. UWO 241]
MEIPPPNKLLQSYEIISVLHVRRGRPRASIPKEMLGAAERGRLTRRSSCSDLPRLFIDQGATLAAVSDGLAPVHDAVDALEDAAAVHSPLSALMAEAAPAHVMHHQRGPHALKPPVVPRLPLLLLDQHRRSIPLMRFHTHG